MEIYYFCSRKHIEVGLKLSLAAGSKKLCISVLLKLSGKFLPGRQADEYITHGVMFAMFFYVSLFAFMNQMNSNIYICFLQGV